MTTVKVNVKWNKEVFNNVEVDLSEPPVVFKAQLFALTNVPVERQKIMLKGILKDDEWGPFKPAMKDGVTLMMMGTAELPTAPAQKTIFAEDLPEEERDSALNNLPPGLVNLDNTCYFNSTVQVLAGVPELNKTIAAYKPTQADDPASSITVAMKDVLRQLKNTKSAVIPAVLIALFRSVFPNFAEQQNGRFKQQDAEEAWTQMLWCLKKIPKTAEVKVSGADLVEQLFSGKLEATVKCIEAPDEPATIKEETLEDGLKLSLESQIEKASPSLGRDALYKEVKRISALPYYLPIQFVRFFWKAKEQVKAKILRPVTFPFELDMYEFCSDTLKANLDTKRKELLTHREKGTATDFKVEDGVNQTGIYELCAVLTHKGIAADGGHYVAWVKQEDGSWVLFDDDTVSPATEEDITKLNGKGGAQWHMAYMCLYRTKKTWTK